MFILPPTKDGDWLTGTVVQEESDADLDNDSSKQSWVSIKVKGPQNDTKRFPRSRLRNRIIHLSELPTGWTGKIRLADSFVKDSSKTKAKKTKAKGQYRLASRYENSCF